MSFLTFFSINQLWICRNKELLYLFGLLVTSGTTEEGKWVAEIYTVSQIPLCRLVLKMIWLDCSYGRIQISQDINEQPVKNFYKKKFNGWFLFPWTSWRRLLVVSQYSSSNWLSFLKRTDMYDFRIEKKITQGTEVRTHLDIQQCLVNYLLKDILHDLSEIFQSRVKWLVRTKEGFRKSWSTKRLLKNVWKSNSMQ